MTHLEAGTKDTSVHLEKERNTLHPVLILGAGSGIGAEIAKLMASRGRLVFAGTRSLEKFQRIKENVLFQGGTEPVPFIADITNPKEIRHALNDLGLSEGQTIDYFALAAEGFKTTRISIGRSLLKLGKIVGENKDFSKDTNRNELRKAAQQETLELKTLMENPASITVATQTNTVAPLEFAEILRENGNLNPNSKIVVLDSTISKYSQEVDYPGPWFYYPLGITKARGVITLRELSKSIGSTFFDFVAPGITGTEVGEFFDRFLPVLRQLHALDAKDEFEFPTVSAQEVARAIVNKTSMDLQGRKTIDLYVGYQPGIVSTQRPANFNVPIINWL